MNDERSDAPDAATHQQAEGADQAPTGPGLKRTGPGRRPPAPESEPPAPAASASPTGYQLQLPSFEGPLDLLLHLIQKHELDILDIPIAFVTERYLEYITLMQELNLDLASEYLVMAATLLHIKSKSLLPSVPDDEEEELAYEEDPRADLIRRLLEYQKYKLAAAELQDRSLLGRDVFGRGMPAPSSEGPAPLAPIGMFKLLEAFQSVMDRAEIRTDHQIDLERFSITDRISELSDVLRARPRLVFEELFAGQSTRSALIITFLALLEMTRLRMTRLTQAEPLAPIYVELAVIEDDPASEAGAAPATEGGSAEVPSDAAAMEEAAAEEDRAEASESGAKGSRTEEGESAPTAPDAPVEPVGMADASAERTSTGGGVQWQPDAAPAIERDPDDGDPPVTT